MKSAPVAASAAILIVISACSSIIEGTSQTITLNTNPPGADCSLIREGLVIGHVSPTPGSVVVEKTKHDILIKCNKEGYLEATYHNNSGVEGATWGNIVLGGPIGWAIDSASGADNKYESPVNVTLAPSVAVPNTAQSQIILAPSIPAAAPSAASTAAEVADESSPSTCTWNPQEYHYDCW